jgi:hypothetical protein
MEVGSDNFPPSFSQISGHRYKDFEKNADFLSPLLAHPMLFILLNFVEISTRLLEWNKALREDHVLRIVYRLFGYKDLALPESISKILGPKEKISNDFMHDNIDISTLVRLEANKARAITSGKKPKYGIVTASERISPAGAIGRTRAIIEGGMQGLILQVGPLPGPSENLAAIGEVLRTAKL